MQQEDSYGRVSLAWFIHLRTSRLVVAVVIIGLLATVVNLSLSSDRPGSSTRSATRLNAPSAAFGYPSAAATDRGW
jgi:hypothetical protein